MLKSYSQLVGLPVKAMGREMKLGRVKDLILDPEKGALIALKTGTGQGVAPSDIYPFKQKAWEVKAPDSIMDLEELARVQKFSKKHVQIVGKKVLNKEADYLGRVTDYWLDMETLSLVQLVVAKQWWGWIEIKTLMIPWKKIIQITENAIVVEKTDSTIEEHGKETIFSKQLNMGGVQN